MTETSTQPPLEAEIIQVGMVLCFLVMVPGALLGTERHHYPKEAVLAVAAFVAALVCFRRRRRLSIDAVDLCWGGFLVLSLVSAVAAAGQPWFSLRSLGLSLAGMAVYWTVRRLACEGLGEAMLNCAVVALCVVALTGVLEAYGLVSGLSLANRAPGGTMGNRNRLAELLVIGFPVLWLQGLRARTRQHLAVALLGSALAAGAVLLSRCRGAWLAAIVMCAVAALLFAACRGASPGPHRRRILLLAAAPVAGILAALAFESPLAWSTGSPYGDSLAGIANYRTGSGRGRLVQYANTARIIADHPVLGVGPGNWAVAYPRYATPGDPSYVPDNLLPTNRTAHSDWLGLAAERGIPALALLLAGGVLLLGRFARALRGAEASSRERLQAAAGILVLVALAVTGSLDSVLLTAAPTFLVFLTLGAVASPGGRNLELSLSPVQHRAGLSLVFAAGMVPVAYVVLQLAGGTLYGRSGAPSALRSAVLINPGDYAAHMYLAQHWAESGRCDLALPLIRSAAQLYPTAQAPGRLREECSTRGPRTRTAASGEAAAR
jgi:O-antigen ligase